jgi:hypothetical protein
MKHRSPWLAGLAAITLALITTATAFGYAAQVAAAVTVGTQGGPVKCGAALVVTATVLDANGKPIVGQLVYWSFASTPSSADVIKKSPTKTDGKGVARTIVVLACVPGSRTIRAKAGTVYASAVLGVTGGGLPNTSTLPGETPAPQDLSLLGTLLAVLAMAAGGVLALRRISLSRR